MNKANLNVPTHNEALTLLLQQTARSKVTGAELSAIAEMWPPPRGLGAKEALEHSVRMYRERASQLSQQERHDLDILVARFATSDFGAATEAMYWMLYRVFLRIFIDSEEDQWSEHSNWSASERFKEAISSIMPDNLTGKFLRETCYGFDGMPPYNAMIGFFQAAATSIIETSEAISILSAGTNIQGGGTTSLLTHTGITMGQVLRTFLKKTESGKSDGEILVVAKAAAATTHAILDVYIDAKSAGTRRDGAMGYKQQLKRIAVNAGEKLRYRALPQSVCIASVSTHEIQTPVVIKDETGAIVCNKNGEPAMVKRYAVYRLYVPLDEDGHELNVAGIKQVTDVIKDVMERNRRTRSGQSI